MRLQNVNVYVWTGLEAILLSERVLPLVQAILKKWANFSRVIPIA